jgi:hypothetical protein
VTREEVHDFVVRCLDEDFNSRRPATADHQRPVLETRHPRRGWLESRSRREKGQD